MAVEVALVGEAAGEGGLHRRLARQQLAVGLLQLALQAIGVGRQGGGGLEGAQEVMGADAGIPRQFAEADPSSGASSRRRMALATAPVGRRGGAA